MLDYSGDDLDIFLGKAEVKLTELGEELYTQLKYGQVDDSLVDKINLLSIIIDSIEETTDEDEIKVLVNFALDYYNLSSTTYSPYNVLPTTTVVINTGGGTGEDGSDGVGIDNIALFSTVGLVKTYRVTLTDTSYYDIVVNDGLVGSNGASAYTYVAYASDSSGTGFTTTFNSSLDYIAIKASTIALTPIVSDFTGLWKNYKGVAGANGLNAPIVQNLSSPNTTDVLSTQGVSTALALKQNLLSFTNTLQSLISFNLNWSLYSTYYQTNGTTPEAITSPTITNATLVPWGYVFVLKSRHIGDTLTGWLVDNSTVAVNINSASVSVIVKQMGRGFKAGVDNHILIKPIAVDVNGRFTEVAIFINNLKTIAKTQPTITDATTTVFNVSSGLATDWTITTNRILSVTSIPEDGEEFSIDINNTNGYTVTLSTTTYTHRLNGVGTVTSIVLPTGATNKVTLAGKLRGTEIRWNIGYFGS